MDSLCWYVSYGSNMRADRLGFYLSGGRPPGATRTYPGARDARAPRDTRGVTLPGSIYFALESTVWTGGMAFYDPSAAGQAAGRAYLITVSQFSDIAAQEMHRAPGNDLRLDAVLADGACEVGPGRYETLVHAGDIDGIPMLTFTAPWGIGDVTPTAPSGPYLGMLARGLIEAHGWEPATVSSYLCSLPGAAGTWGSRPATGDRDAVLVCGSAGDCTCDEPVELHRLR